MIATPQGGQKAAYRPAWTLVNPRTRVKMSTRKKRSDPDLRNASIHVGYEIKQYNYTVDRLARGIDRDSDVGLHNTVLTSYIAFGRNVLQFLYDDKPQYEDDVIAADYFDDPTYWQS